MNEHKEIILEALIDYRGWFVDREGNTVDDNDVPTVNSIDNAIKFVELCNN